MATKRKCECPERGVLSLFADWYDPETELPYVDHEPGECKCTNELKKYKRDGKVLWLCSCCCLNSDEEYEDD